MSSSHHDASNNIPNFLEHELCTISPARESDDTKSSRAHSSKASLYYHEDSITSIASFESDDIKISSAHSSRSANGTRIWNRIGRFFHSSPPSLNGSVRTTPETWESVVSFTANEIFEIPNRDDYDENEIALLWYSRDECDEIKEIIGRTIGKMEKGRPLKPKKYCARGLEAMTDKGYFLKEFRRQEVYDAVFGELRAQNESGKTNPGAIADLYSFAAIDSRMAARLLAQKDEQEVNDYMKNDMFMAQTLRQISFHGRIEEIMAEEPIFKPPPPPPPPPAELEVEVEFAASAAVYSRRDESVITTKPLDQDSSSTPDDDCSADSRSSAGSRASSTGPHRGRMSKKVSFTRRLVKQDSLQGCVKRERAKQDSLRQLLK
jgi:hypothetical protein